MFPLCPIFLNGPLGIFASVPILFRKCKNIFSQVRLWIMGPLKFSFGLDLSQSCHELLSIYNKAGVFALTNDTFFVGGGDGEL